MKVIFGVFFDFFTGRKSFSRPLFSSFSTPHSHFHGHFSGIFHGWPILSFRIYNLIFTHLHVKIFENSHFSKIFTGRFCFSRSLFSFFLRAFFFFWRALSWNFFTGCKIFFTGKQKKHWSLLQEIEKKWVEGVSLQEYLGYLILNFFISAKILSIK